MKWLLGTFGQGWNARRGRRGHVFQGRYKAVPVSVAADSPHYFQIVADYIHLNPARAGLAGGRRGKLVSWKWSSLCDYARGSGPGWLVFDRVLAAFELVKDGRGRRAYVAWLEQRAANGEDGIGAEAMAALKRGWYPGEPTFADKLRSLVEGKRSRAVGDDPVARSHDEAGAEELAIRALAAMGLPSDPGPCGATERRRQESPRGRTPAQTHIGRQPLACRTTRNGSSRKRESACRGFRQRFREPGKSA